MQEKCDQFKKGGLSDLFLKKVKHLSVLNSILKRYGGMNYLIRYGGIKYILDMTVRRL